MKFVWNEPEPSFSKTKPSYPYPKPNWELPVWAWLSYLGIWNNPNSDPHKPLEYDDRGCLVPDPYYDQRNLLKFSGIYLHHDPKQWELYYNYVYHFYDIKIYESWVPGTEPRGAIDRMTAYLKASKLQWKSDFGAWRWDKDASGKDVMRTGVRFWIYAEDHVKPDIKPKAKKIRLTYDGKVRYVTIPNGWHRVTDGVVLKGDKLYYPNWSTPGFYGSDTIKDTAHKVGWQVKSLICVIRKD